MSMQQVIARRALLLQRIAQQRAEFGILAQSLQGPASLYDKGYSITQKIRQHPKLISGAALLTLIIFRKRLPIIKMGMTALTVVKGWLSLKSRLLPVWKDVSSTTEPASRARTDRS